MDIFKRAVGTVSELIEEAAADIARDEALREEAAKTDYLRKIATDELKSLPPAGASILSSLLARLNEYEKANCELEAAARLRRKGDTEAVNRWKQKAEGLERDAARLEAKIGELSEARRVLTETVDTMEESDRQKANRINALEEELARLGSESLRSEEDSKIKMSYEMAHAEYLQDAKETVSRLTVRLREAEERAANYRKELSALKVQQQQESMPIVAQLAQSNQKLAQLRQALASERDLRLREVADITAQMHARVNALEKQVKAGNETVAKLETKLCAVEKDLGECNDKLLKQAAVRIEHRRETRAAHEIGVQCCTDEGSATDDITQCSGELLLGLEKKSSVETSAFEASPKDEANFSIFDMLDNSQGPINSVDDGDGRRSRRLLLDLELTRSRLRLFERECIRLAQENEELRQRVASRRAAS